MGSRLTLEALVVFTDVRMVARPEPTTRAVRSLEWRPMVGAFPMPSLEV